MNRCDKNTITNEILYPNILKISDDDAEIFINAVIDHNHNIITTDCLNKKTR